MCIRDRLCAQLGREPTLSELAEHTGLSPEEIAAAETAAEPPVSLQAETGEGGLTLEGMLTAGGEAVSYTHLCPVGPNGGRAGISRRAVTYKSEEQTIWECDNP